MADYAIQRPDFDPNTMTLEDWMTREIQRNPSYQVPTGWHVDGGKVVRDQPNFLLRHPWLFPAAGIGAGAGLAAAGVGAGSAAAGGGTAAGATGAGTTAAAATGAAAASTPLWMQIARLAAPAVGTALATRGNGSSGGNGIDPQTSSQINQLLQLASERAQRTVPVHEAAMQLAMNLAPTATTSPRLQAAVQQAQQPHPRQGIDPQVSEAIQRLMGGR